MPPVLESLLEDAYKTSVLEGLAPQEDSFESESPSLEASFRTASKRRPKFLLRLCDLEDENCRKDDVCLSSCPASLEQSGEASSVTTDSNGSQSTQSRTDRQQFLSSLFQPGIFDRNTNQVRPSFSESFTFTAEGNPATTEKGDTKNGTEVEKDAWLVAQTDWILLFVIF